jgi:hypothetical protein
MEDNFLRGGGSLTITREELREELQAFATKEDLKSFATKEDLKRFATKEDLKRFATKEDLDPFLVEDDLERWAKRIMDQMKVLFEQLESDLKRYVEGTDVRDRVGKLETRVDDIEGRVDQNEFRLDVLEREA